MSKPEMQVSESQPYEMASDEDWSFSELNVTPQVFAALRSGTTDRTGTVKKCLRKISIFNGVFTKLLNLEVCPLNTASLMSKSEMQVSESQPYEMASDEDDNGGRPYI